mmetsp:Transcript_2320/g.4348  ORF Transcript_2320/g.4348 Transcript_2320/m.4348 type:complete len:90 (-) Transcript_2320:115-384(-)
MGRCTLPPDHSSSLWRRFPSCSTNRHCRTTINVIWIPITVSQTYGTSVGAQYLLFGPNQHWLNTNRCQLDPIQQQLDQSDVIWTLSGGI